MVIKLAYRLTVECKAATAAAATLLLALNLNPSARSHRGRHRVPRYEQLRPLAADVTLALKELIQSPLGDDTYRYSNQPGLPVSKGKPPPTCYPTACLP